MDEVKLLPCAASVKIAKAALRKRAFKGADDDLGRAVASAEYRMQHSEIARFLLRFVANTRAIEATRPTDEAVERVARAIYGAFVLRTDARVPRDIWASLARAAIAAMPTIVQDGEKP